MTTQAQPDGLLVQRGLPDRWHATAARMYREAFGSKLRPILGDGWTSTRLITQAIQPACALAASIDGELVGIAGFHHEGKRFVDICYRPMIREFGVMSGTARALAGQLLERPTRTGELLMDGIVTRQDRRGQGVGSALFTELLAFGLDHGYLTVRLDVVDTNPRAQALYERLGFRCVRTQRYPWMRSLFGFGAVTTMEQSLGRRLR